MKLLVLEKTEYDDWISKLRYVEYQDPKGYEGVRYIRCSEAGISFPKSIEPLIVDENVNGSGLIEIATGEQVYIFEENDIKKHIQKREGRRNVDPNKLYELAASRRHNYPNISLVYPTHNNYTSTEKVILDKPIKVQNLSDGDLILIQRKSIEELISDCEHEIWKRGVSVSYCARMLRSGEDFLESLGHIEGNKVSRLEEETSYMFRGQRPKVALLYTDEDTNIASYVRTHFDSLDKASGSDCDVLFIENPRAVDSASFWKGSLDEISYVIWRSLGWERSKPYNKAEVYDVAKALDIPLDMLPCALTSEDGEIISESIIKLEGDLTSTFREIFRGYQDNASANLFRSDDVDSEPSDSMEEFKDKEKPVCFLSHNSNDKEIVRKVAASLHTFGIDTWFDEWEILPGDSIVGKIEEGLRKATHLVVFLSKKAVSSSWVSEEINTSLYHAISSKKLAVIPVVIEECEIPMILGSFAQVREMSPGRIATNIQNAVLGITGKPPVKNRA